MVLYKNVKVIGENEITEAEVLVNGEKIEKVAGRIDAENAEIIDG